MEPGKFGNYPPPPIFTPATTLDILIQIRTKEEPRDKYYSVFSAGPGLVRCNYFKAANFYQSE